MTQLPNFSRQYQPPKIPSHWSADERRYAQAVADVLDDIYLRYGRLTKKDLSAALSKEISDATGNIVTINETAQGLEVRIQGAEGDISTLNLTAAALTNRMSDAEGNVSNLQLTASSHASRLTNAEGDIGSLELTATGLGTRLTTAEGDINAVELTASGLLGRMTTAEGDIGAVEMTASGLLTRMQNAEDDITIVEQTADKVNWLVSGGTSQATMTLTNKLYDLFAQRINLAGSEVQVAADGRIDFKASTIDLSANNSIKLAVSGGTNLLPGTTNAYTAANFAGEAFKEIATLQYSGLDAFVSAVEGDKQITISAYIYAQYTSVRLNVVQYGASGSQWRSHTNAATVGAGATAHRSVTFDVHPSATYLRVRLVTWNDSSVTMNAGFKSLKIEVGTMATDWSPAPSDPASGVKTTYMEMLADLFKVYSGGTIELNAGAVLRMLAAVFQLDASDANNSYISFGDAFYVGRDSGGNFSLMVNTNDSDGIKVNGNPVLHRGNVKIQQAQPPSGNNTLWGKPTSTTSVQYKSPTLTQANSYYSQSAPSRVFTLSPVTGDVMTAAGTYTFKLKLTLHNTGPSSYPLTSLAVALTKGGKTLNFSTGGFTVPGNSDYVVELTTTTTDPDFVNDTGTFQATVTIGGLVGYSTNHLMHHAAGSVVQIDVTGPGSATAQPIQWYLVP